MTGLVIGIGAGLTAAAKYDGNDPLLVGLIIVLTTLGGALANGLRQHCFSDRELR